MSLNTSTTIPLNTRLKRNNIIVLVFHISITVLKSTDFPSVNRLPNMSKLCGSEEINTYKKSCKSIIKLYYTYAHTGLPTKDETSETIVRNLY